MKLFESRRTKFLRTFFLLFPALLLVLSCTLFVAGVSSTSDQAVQKEQNALEQARQFKEVCDITGIILTKLDGTAKGGIAVAIQSELGIPVKYIGVGESIEDLQKFDADEFVNALFHQENNE